MDRLEKERKEQEEIRKHFVHKPGKKLDLKKFET
jgi:hypothetical protein